MSRTSRSQSAATRRPPLQYLLWIDGVGSYLVCLGERVTVGGPNMGDTSPEDLGSQQRSADVALLANLSRCHATIVRNGEGYYLDAHAPTKVAQREVHERMSLHNGYTIELGGSAMLRFCLPTELSASARIEFVSDHRPPRSVDGVVLMDDTCLLGPGNENHVRCNEWPGSVLIFRKDNRLWCKSRLEVFVGDQHVTEESLLNAGDIVTGPDLRFRLEAVHPEKTAD